MLHKQVLVTLADHPSKTHRFAVVVIDEQGEPGQEVLCRSLRDARIYANGLCHGAMLAHGFESKSPWPVNPTVDSIFDDLETI